MERISRSRSVQGIQIVSEHIPTVRSLTVGVWVKTGSRHETEGESGITHVIEHMLFKGTQNRSAFEIARSVEAAGGHINAFTANEYTCYYVRCLDSDLKNAMDVLADMISAPLFDAGELKKEKRVILEEMKMYRDTPDDFVMEEFTAALFKGHALGRPIIGTEKTVKGFKPADLQNYLNVQYVPSNLIVAVSGNCVHEDIETAVNLAFAALPWSGEPHAESRAPEPVKPFSIRFSKKIEQAHFITGKQSVSVNDPNRYVMLMLTTVLSGGMSSRLHQNIREKYGYCYTIHAFNHSFLDSGYFGVYTGTDTAHLDEMKRLIFKEFERLRSKPVSDQELGECKAQLKGKVLLSQENMSNRMMRIAKNEVYYGKQVTLDELVDNIESVSSSQLQIFCQDFLNPESFSDAILTPEIA